MPIAWFRKSLSARLLVLTIFFVMLAEVLIYAPSIARFRLVYLQEKLAAGHLAALAIEATPDGMVTRELAATLLSHVGAHEIEVFRDAVVTHMLTGGSRPVFDESLDLRQGGFLDLLTEAFVTLAQGGNRVLLVTGPSLKDPDVLVRMLIDERPLRVEMLDYSRRILQLSIVISLFTAALVYLSLQLLIVVPMRRITASMTGFRRDPESPRSDIGPTDRGDEMGVAQRELAHMQEAVRSALRQRARLAALGAAIGKMSHDLRNTLATAQLVTDALQASNDPMVSRAAPRLMRAIDRAVQLSSQTLSFIQERPPLAIEEIDLGELVEDVASEVAPGEDGAGRLLFASKGEASVRGDRLQLYRILANLARNALQAGARHVTVSLAAHGGTSEIEVADDGPGIPEAVRERLFEPFTHGANTGGSGLGLAIVRDLVETHGGTIALAATGPDGTRFRITLPRAGLTSA